MLAIQYRWTSRVNPDVHLMDVLHSRAHARLVERVKQRRICQFVAIFRVYTHHYILKHSYSLRQPITMNTDSSTNMQHVFEGAARYFSVLSEPARLKILHSISVLP